MLIFFELFKLINYDKFDYYYLIRILCFQNTYFKKNEITKDKINL